MAVSSRNLSTKELFTMALQLPRQYLQLFPTLIKGLPLDYLSILTLFSFFLFSSLQPTSSQLHSLACEESSSFFACAVLGAA
jgi:hypothetical protein